jgi:1-acyl-sn-glycerol-3-phosphate acyltransferase
VQVKYRVSRALAGPILHLLWRPEVTGGEHIPATGGAILASNHLSVDRGDTRSAQETLQAALGLLQAGELFGIYPEGTRSPDGRLYRGRTGVGWLALASGLPVIPVAMIGTDRVLAPGHSIPSLHRVGVRVGEPLTFAGYQDHKPPARARRAITDEVMKAIGELSGQESVPMYASARKDELAAQAAERGR